jgi:CDP-diacylglycerol--serine O-phosphatidyltransferase
MRLQYPGGTKAELMARLTFKERFFDPRPPARRPRRAAYALPTLFTAGNIFLGFLAILRAVEGALVASSGQLGPNPHFEVAAKAIGAAVVLDGLDGRIARMTNTVSAFGREMDSLADVITFGIAPAVLAYTWGVQFVVPGGFLTDHRAGYFLAFIFLLCGAARLARFNVQTNPVPTNPGRPDRKYFVGLPIPAAAGLVAAVVYATDSTPVEQWLLSGFWLAVLALLSFLMVCTWRYPSFKEINLKGPRSPLTVILFGSLIYLIWNYSQPVLLALAMLYVSTGIVLRAAGIVRRRFRPQPPSPQPEHQTS